MTAQPAFVVPAGTPASGDSRVLERRGRIIVAALAITQTLGYGALYYAFAVLLVPMATDLEVSTTAVTGALTAATLAGAATAVPAGRWLDRHGGRVLMTAGSIAGTVLLLLAAHVHSLIGLYAVWLGIGLVSATVLYEAAFAVVITWYPDPRQRATAVLAITVVAGLASSIMVRYAVSVCGVNRARVPDRSRERCIGDAPLRGGSTSRPATGPNSTGRTPTPRWRQELTECISPARSENVNFFGAINAELATRDVSVYRPLRQGRPDTVETVP
jgi:hypothetical protein